MNRFVYHYLARSVEGDTEYLFDGIAQLESKIVDMNDYRRLKELICEADTKRDWSIMSLSFLGMEK